MSRRGPIVAFSSYDGGSRSPDGRSTVQDVKRDTAERLAATIVPGVSVEDAQAIIQEFLTQLARCPVCDGTGMFTFASDVKIDARDPTGHPLVDARVDKGTTTSCPCCGGEKWDPEFVAWHCFRGDRNSDCQHDKNGDKGRREPHANCGYRVMLPLVAARRGHGHLDAPDT
jgi:hypothetical protein